MLIKDCLLYKEKLILSLKKKWRGARVVMEQIANLSTRKRCQGSNPCLRITAL